MLVNKNDNHIEHDHFLISEELNLNERIWLYNKWWWMRGFITCLRIKHSFRIYPIKTFSNYWKIVKNIKEIKHGHFGKVSPHNFEDCVKKNWTDFTINIPDHTKHIQCKNIPYQTIDSGLFYKK